MNIFFITIILLIFSYKDSLSCGSYNIEKPPIMNNWNGYFDPRINFYNSCGRHNNLYPGQIRYLLKELMNFGWVFKGQCSSDYTHALMYPSESGRSDTTEKKAFPKKLPDEEYVNPCICLIEVSIGTYNWPYTNYGPLVGCIPIPLPPGPPPFCEQFEPEVHVNIVPDVESTYSNPRIRTVIGVNNLAKCSDGTTIAEGLQCSDGKPSTKDKPYAATLTQGDQIIAALNKNHKFRTRIEDGNICSAYYGDKEIVDKNLIFDQCYDIPAMPKPHAISISNRSDPHKIQKGDTITYDISDRNTPTQRNLLECCEKENSSKLQLIRPTLNEFYEFNIEHICVNKYNKIQRAFQLSDGSYGCDEKQGYVLTSNYIDSPTGNVACISGWFPAPKEFMLTRQQNDQNGNTITRKEEIVMLGNAFVAYKYEANMLKIDTSQQPLTVQEIIKRNEDNLDAARLILDSIDNLGEGLISMTTPTQFGEKKMNFQYTNIVYQDKNTGKSTNFVYKNGSPVFLTQDEILNEKFKYYRPTDPHLLGLCTGQILKTETVTDQSKSVLNTDSICDFLRIEAWGAGAAASLDTDASASGSSGGYTFGVINTNGKRKVISITLGNGGSTISASGENTIVDICDSVNTNCKTVITALGGNNNATSNNINGAALIAPEVLFPEAFLGASGITETPYNSNPNVALGYNHDYSENMFMKFSETECAKNSITQMTITKAKNVSGGCVSREKNVWQPGGDGKVIVTCEQWRQSGSKGVGITYVTEGPSANQFNNVPPVASNIPSQILTNNTPGSNPLDSLIRDRFRLDSKEWDILWKTVDFYITRHLPAKKDPSITFDKVYNNVNSSIGASIENAINTGVFSGKGNDPKYFRVIREHKNQIRAQIKKMTQDKYNSLPD